MTSWCGILTRSNFTACSCELLITQKTKDFRELANTREFCRWSGGNSEIHDMKFAAVSVYIQQLIKF